MTESKKQTNNQEIVPEYQQQKAFKENISLVLISIMAYKYKIWI